MKPLPEKIAEETDPAVLDGMEAQLRKDNRMTDELARAITWRRVELAKAGR